MITKVAVANLEDTTGIERKQYTVSPENLAKIVQQLINAYKHPVESTIREYAMNARDAMKLTGQTKPMEVTTPTPLKKSLMIRDYAGGLTDKETEELLFSFGASDVNKQTSNKYVGGFGIGSKSGFTLSDSFTFTVFKNGTETVWNCMLDQYRYPAFMKLQTQETTEQDGVLVTIPTTENIDERIATSVLEWLDVPCLLNGKPVEPILNGSKMSGSVYVDGNKCNWYLTGNSAANDITFVVGCGAIRVNKWDLPNKIKTKLTIPDYVDGRVIIELPVGCVSLMTSREDMIYDKRTCEILVPAINKSIEDIRNKALESVLSTKTKDEFLDALIAFRKITGSHMFLSLVRGNPDISARATGADIRKRVLRRLEIGSESGVESLALSAPYTAWRRRSRRYRTFIVRPGEKTELAKRELYLMDTRPDIDWSSGFVEELNNLIEGDLLYSMDMTGINFEAFGWDELKIRLLPSNVRRFTGIVKDHAERTYRWNNSNSEPVTLTLCGDIPTMKKFSENTFPGAEIEIVKDVDTFKNQHKMKVDDGRVVRKRNPIGWLSCLDVSRACKLDTPEGVFSTCMNVNNAVQVSCKSSFKTLDGCKKPVVRLGVDGADSRTDCKTLEHIRVISMFLLLANADVAKNSHGMPIIALVPKNRDVAGVDAKFKCIEELADSRGDEETRNQYAMWLLSQFNRRGIECDYSIMSVGHDGRGSRIDTSAGYGCHALTELSVIMDGAVKLYKSRSAREKRKWPEKMRKDMETLSKLYCRPERFPLYDRVSFSPSVCGSYTNKYVTAMKNLFKGIAILEHLFDKHSLGTQMSPPREFAEMPKDVMTLLDGKAKREACKKDKNEDAGQRTEGKEAVA